MGEEYCRVAFTTKQSICLPLVVQTVKCPSNFLSIFLCFDRPLFFTGNFFSHKISAVYWITKISSIIDCAILNYCPVCSSWQFACPLSGSPRATWPSGSTGASRKTRWSRHPRTEGAERWTWSWWSHRAQRKHGKISFSCFFVLSL